MVGETRPKSAFSTSERTERTTRGYDKLTKLLNPSRAPRSSNEISEALGKIRRTVMNHGLPESDPRGSLRPRIWKLMLGVESLSAQEYLGYVSMGPCEVSTKIKNDTFRTLATDKEFKGKVDEEMLIRLLEAFIWKSKGDDRNGLPFTYVQGMNVLAAPFLYTMPSQLEAFACFSTFIESHCPLYVQPTLVGVHRGLKLLDTCLERVDVELFEYLRSKNLSAEIYAFPSVLTLCACTPPLEEVLKLWDFLLAYGVHLNILCVIAQLNLIRDEIMESPSPMKILRTFPPLDAKPVIDLTVAFITDLDDDLYAELVDHPYVP